MYVADPRFTPNLDAQAEGYAQFLSEAIARGTLPSASIVDANP